jgi:hypothetical protein
MRTVDITLRIVYDEDLSDPPDRWDWWSLLDFPYPSEESEKETITITKMKVIR